MPTPAPGFILRRYRPEDLDALYDICLKTGDTGEDATGLYRDPEVLGHLYAGPYATLEPELAFVIEDEAPSTRASRTNGSRRFAYATPNPRATPRAGRETSASSNTSTRCPGRTRRF
jgi:hypothetical protein